MTSKPKNKGILFSSTLKVGENKVSLFFRLEFIYGIYGHFVISAWDAKRKSKQSTKLPYISDVTSKKIKALFSILKVGENKVLLFFGLETKSSIYDNFVIPTFLERFLSQKQGMLVARVEMLQMSPNLVWNQSFKFPHSKTRWGSEINF